MKKRLVVFVAMLLCAVTVLSSCSLSALRVLDQGAYTEALVPTVATALSFGGKYTSQRGNLVYISHPDENDLDTIAVYNLATDKMLFEAQESSATEGETTTAISYEVRLGGDGQLGWFCVEKITVTGDDREKSFTLYDENGTEIAASTNKDAVLQTAADLVLLDGKVYRATEKKIEYVFDWQPTAEFPQSIRKVGTRYVQMKGNEVIFYDGKLNVKGTHVLPANQINADASIILDNGNLLFQYVEKLPETAKEWSYVENGEKYAIVSVLLNTKKAKAKMLELDFLMYDEGMSYTVAPARWERDGISKHVKNIAFVHMVEDGRLSSDKVMVELSNNGKMKTKIELVDGMRPRLPSLVAKDRWIVEDKVGHRFLINAAGKIIGDISNFSYDAAYNQIGFECDGKLYSWDLEVKYDLYENEMTVSMALDNGYVLTDKDGATYYMGADYTAQSLIGKDETAKTAVLLDGERLFAVKEDSTWRIYNSMGVQMMTLEHVLSVEIVASVDDALLLYARAVEGHTSASELYRLTA